MRYIEFREALKKFLVFNLKEIYKIESNFDARRLYEWQEKGYIIKIINGYYIFNNDELSENMLYEIANRIYRHSYVSLESALNYYGLIPEQTYMILSVSTRKTTKFNTQIGNFSYRKISKQCFFGYGIERIGEICWKIASPEKALVDYLYFNSDIKTKKDIMGIRINPDIFNDLININTLNIFINVIKNKRVGKCINYLVEEMSNA